MSEAVREARRLLAFLHAGMRPASAPRAVRVELSGLVGGPKTRYGFGSRGAHGFVATCEAEPPRPSGGDTYGVRPQDRVDDLLSRGTIWRAADDVTALALVHAAIDASGVRADVGAALFDCCVVALLARRGVRVGPDELPPVRQVRPAMLDELVLAAKPDALARAVARNRKPRTLARQVGAAGIGGQRARTGPRRRAA